MMRAQRDGGFVFVSRACPRDLAFQEMAGFYSRYSNRSASASVCSAFMLESRRKPQRAPRTAAGAQQRPDSFWVIYSSTHANINHKPRLVQFPTEINSTGPETSPTSIHPLSIALISTELVLK